MNGCNADIRISKAFDARSNATESFLFGAPLFLPHQLIYLNLANPRRFYLPSLGCMQSLDNAMAKLVNIPDIGSALHFH